MLTEQEWYEFGRSNGMSEREARAYAACNVAEAAYSALQRRGWRADPRPTKQALQAWQEAAWAYVQLREDR